ncbi:MAG TPA: zinc-binding dehydrogenase [Caldilineaceae bacterium]|nr:zinc-binding dehydrogenase [Caldilineaceae bacterium]
MKKVVIVDKCQSAIVDVPDPTPVENWVVVKVHAAPMCTEYKRFLSGEPTDFLGHEAAGEVVAVAHSSRLQVGDRVVAMPLLGCGKCQLCLAGDYIHCEHTAELNRFFAPSGEGRATYAQYLLKPDWLLPKIPDGVPYDHAALACCGLGPSFGAMQLMQVSAFDTILITGAGPVGLGAVVNALYRGARAIVVEPNPHRAKRARQMGADAVLDPRDPQIVDQIKDLTEGRGVDCALDCSGTVKAQRLCIDAARRKGKVSFIGECMDDLAIRVSPDMIRKGLTLIGAWHYNLREFPRVMQVIQHSPLIDQLVSHIFPMSQVQDAFECSTAQESAKIILHPWE